MDHVTLYNHYSVTSKSHYKGKLSFRLFKYKATTFAINNYPLKFVINKKIIKLKNLKKIMKTKIIIKKLLATQF